MTTITRERLLKIQQWRETYGTGSNVMLPAEEAEELARIALASLTAEPVAWTDEEELRDLRKVGFCEMFSVEPISKDADMLRVIPLYRHAQPAPEREQIRREHAEWSDATFGDVGPVGPLKHLSKEALESAAEPGDLSEWADMQFLLWDAQRRAGITDEQITQAMIEKLAINKARQWPEPKDGEPRQHIKEQPAPVMPAELHPDTQNLVADFCAALAEKLYKAQLKYGYDADWKQDGWHTQCLAHFHQHIAKGDPRDVAAYCAFMWYHGWKTESVSVSVVPEECPADISVLMASHSDSLFNDDDAQEIWNACRAAMLQSKYRDLSQPVDPQISEYEKIMLQAGNSPVIPDGYALVPVEPTDEMIEAAMNCEDVLFNSDESFCVQFGNIYKAMLAAAPQPEISDGK
ncbi:DUF550 domain-containing protein [Salmonella enterica subsp. enterica]|nr:DUF550 domain-containing protein [Salmonella enterica subsp. enterica]